MHVGYLFLLPFSSSPVQLKLSTKFLDLVRRDLNARLSLPSMYVVRTNSRYCVCDTLIIDSIHSIKCDLDLLVDG